MDGVEFNLSSSIGSFTKAGAGKVYKFISRAEAIPCIKLTLDLGKGAWTCAISKTGSLTSGVDNSDGVGIFLAVSKSSDSSGTFRAFGDTVKMTERTNWEI